MPPPPTEPPSKAGGGGGVSQSPRWAPPASEPSGHVQSTSQSSTPSASTSAAAYAPFGSPFNSLSGQQARQQSPRFHLAGLPGAKAVGGAYFVTPRSAAPGAGGCGAARYDAPWQPALPKTAWP